MKGSTTQLAFRKTAACPASATLLAFRARKLSSRRAGEVRNHLEVCDFCSAELPLLAHHTRGARGRKPPDIPMNLRILAESILGHKA